MIRHKSGMWHGRLLVVEGASINMVVQATKLRNRVARNAGSGRNQGSNTLKKRLGMMAPPHHETIRKNDRPKLQRSD
jgi:hypothetical protein